MTEDHPDYVVDRDAAREQLARLEAGAKEAYQRCLLDPSELNLEDWISARKVAESYRWLNIGNAEGLDPLLNADE